ncbi:hypothetical protein CA13_40900 [Planctomycetes bacterium CA13]|uniref:Uncharacterized protein n=1 Tax=Novipirellula herctigrandis TaxID=2527986 RepID=A0A5C5Z6C1_9BACT|nr:hypothetical protein CA13_40900 [Planctomycetes bacterium CA13]
MIDFSYLYKGICGLAHAHRAGTMAGHLGAAVVAGYFIGEDQSELPDEVCQGIEGEMERVISGEEAIWFDAKKAGVTPTTLFDSFPDEPANAETIESIVVALHKSVGTLKQSGHNVIFASIAVRALRDHEDYATPQIVTGIRKLIERFKGAASGRGYYGKELGWVMGDKVELSAENDFPKYKSIQQMVNVTIDELIESAAIKRQGFGGLWHIINHAAAITELNRFGYKEVAMSALPAHHQHIRLWRSLPDVEEELGAVVKAMYDPRDARYWDGKLKRDEALLTHRIKTFYGFHAITRFIEEETQRNKAEDAFLYLMA